MYIKQTNATLLAQIQLWSEQSLQTWRNAATCTFPGKRSRLLFVLV